MKKLIIVGAGGFGREIFSWANKLTAEGIFSDIKGFIDDNPIALQNYHYKKKIIGEIRDYQPKKDEIYAMGIAAPTKKKLEIARMLKERGAEFISLIHPSVFIGSNIQIGQGCILCPNVILSCDIRIGDFVTFNVLSTVGHDAIVGDGCTFNSFVNINGFVKIGKGVEVGSHGTILPNCQIGDFAKIGAGSAVVKSVKANATVLGVPARKIL
jgi:sugar O-acyltransferase (sialic acid O-acetyltransferase NeuD family)